MMRILIFLTTLFFLSISMSYSNIFVQTGAFSKKEGAEILCSEIKKHNFSAFVYKQDNLYLVLVGTFAKKEDAISQQKKIKALGYDAVIKEIKDITFQEKSKKSPEKEKKGDIVDEFSLLQVGVFSNIESARELKGELEKKGYFSFIIYQVKNGEELYKVVVGQKEGKPLIEILDSIKSEYEVTIIR